MGTTIQAEANVAVQFEDHSSIANSTRSSIAVKSTKREPLDTEDEYQAVLSLNDSSLYNATIKDDRISDTSSRSSSSNLEDLKQVDENFLIGIQALESAWKQQCSCG